MKNQLSYGGNQNPKNVIFEFFIHVLNGSFVFILIFCAALGLNHLVILAEKSGFDHFICNGLKFAEYTIFILDIFAYIIFLIISTFRFLIRILSK